MPEDSLKPIGLNRERLSEMMKARDLDAIFLSSPENVFYATGYPTLPSSGNPIVYALRNQLPFFAFIGKDMQVSLLAWGGAAMGIDYEVEDVRLFFTYDMSVDIMRELIQEKLAPGSRVGVESTFPYYGIQLIQAQTGGTSPEIVDDIFGRLRLIKSAAEIERIRQSTHIIDRTLMELVPALHLGMSRLELIREAKYRLMKNGAGGVDHVTVAFGAANPEVALGELLEENQIVTLDLGAAYEGYVSDNRRLVYTGAVPEELRALHQKLCHVVDAMGKSLVPGKTFAELHTHAYELYAEAGLEPMFMHVGHSVGLQVDERWILGEDETTIEPGMVLNIELYSPSEEGVMIGDEETFVVTENGSENVGQLPADIIERRLA